MTYTISAEPAAGAQVAEVGVLAATSNTPRPATIPTMMPRDEVFFWTHAWQAGEEESAAERAAGNLRTFDDPNDLIRWLLTPED